MNKTKPESYILSEVLESTRNLTKQYLGWLKGVDFEIRYPVKGVALNSALWITAHLVCSEHLLLVEALGGKPMKIPWLKKFLLGSKPLHPGKGPKHKDVLKAMEAVHRAALKTVRSLEDGDLDRPNAFGYKFRGKNNKRNVIHHAIGHDAFHAGQLGWICKLNGIKTV